MSRSATEWQSRNGPWEGWIVFINGLPVVPRLEKPFTLHCYLENVGQLLDKLSKLLRIAVKQVEEAVDELRRRYLRVLIC